jgi:hypothetical protein
MVDILISSPDNVGKDVDDGNQILIKKEDLKAVNDPQCQHFNTEIDTSEELGIAHMCKDCHRGWIERVTSPS